MNHLDQQFFNAIPTFDLHNFDGNLKTIPLTPDKKAIAYDSQLITAPNSAFPQELLSWIDPRIIPVFTARKNSTELFTRMQKGDWTTESAIFTVVEHVGEVAPYGDYSNAAMADINPVFPRRTQFLLQTHIRVGDREIAMAGNARIDLVAHKQQAAATVITQENNRINLYGIAGLPIYGLFNEPNLATPIANPNPAFDTATFLQIFNTIVKVGFKQLVAQTYGAVDENSRIVLAVAPSTRVDLGTIADYTGRSVLEALEGYFTNLRVVSLPELEATGTKNMYIIAEDIDGIESAQYGYSIDLKTFPIIQEGSSFRQKWASSNYGLIAFYPLAIQEITGV